MNIIFIPKLHLKLAHLPLSPKAVLIRDLDPYQCVSIGVMSTNLLKHLIDGKNEITFYYFYCGIFEGIDTNAYPKKKVASHLSFKFCLKIERW